MGTVFPDGGISKGIDYCCEGKSDQSLIVYCSFFGYLEKPLGLNYGKGMFRF